MAALGLALSHMGCQIQGGEWLKPGCVVIDVGINAAAWHKQTTSIFSWRFKNGVFSQHRLLSLGIQFPLFLLFSSTLSLTKGGAGQTAQLYRVLEELPVP